MNSICVESTTTEGAPVAEGRPTGGPTGEERQGQKHAHHWQRFTHDRFPGGRFLAKFGCQPIRLELYPLVHVFAANYGACTSGISGYIKGAE